MGWNFDRNYIHNAKYNFLWCEIKTFSFEDGLLFQLCYTEDTCSQFYGWLRLIRSVWRASKFSFLKFIEIVILWVYYTIPFGFSLFWDFLVVTSQVFNLCFAQDHWWVLSSRNAYMVNIVNLIGFKCCINLRRSLYLNLLCISLQVSFYMITHFQLYKRIRIEDLHHCKNLIRKVVHVC